MFLLAMASLRAWLARGAAAAPLVALLLIVVGCDEPLVPLIEVTDLSPRELEAGERFELQGSGFPQGRTARVALEGRLFRSGGAPRGRVSVDAVGVVTAPDRIEIVVDEELATRLCGPPDRAAHATFRGDVEVSFASDDPGAPPLVGKLRGVTLDVTPAAPRARALAERAAEGARALAFLGITPGEPTDRGVPIVEVRPGSIAARAGVPSGGVLSAVDGLNVLSLADVAPASARSAELTIKDGEEERTARVTLVGYSGELVPADYGPALGIVGLALVVLLLFGLRGPPWLVALEARVAGLARESTPRALVAALFGTGAHAAVSALLSAVIAAFALMPYVVGRGLDAPLLVALSASMLIWSRSREAGGAVASTRTAVQVATAAIAMAAAVALTLGHMGVIELAEIVRMQGGAPWQMTAIERPETAVFGAVYGGAIVTVLRARVERRAGAPYAALLERVGVVLASAVGVAVFLGGWQLPGIEIPRRGALLLLLPAALFVLKTWALTGLFFGVSRIASRLRCSDVPRVVVKALVPGLVAGGALAALSPRLLPSGVVETAFGVSFAVVGALLFARVASRVHALATKPEPRASPFL